MMEANLSQNVTMEVSQPGIMPAPAAAGNAAFAEEVEEVHPTLAEDGEKVDEEGARVVAAAQLEELIGPMDEEGEHFSAGDAAENGMVDSPTPPPSATSSSSSSLERATSALPRRGLVIKSAKLSKRAHKSQWPR